MTIERVPNAQSPTTKRWSEERRVNYTDEDGATIVNDAYASVDIPSAEPPGAGNGLRSLGYERITLECAITQGGGALTTVYLLAEISHDGTSWFEHYEDEAGTGVLARKVYEVPVGAATAAVAFEVPALGKRMRWKAWANVASAGSRLTVRATRHMNAS